MEHTRDRISTSLPCQLLFALLLCSSLVSCNYYHRSSVYGSRFGGPSTSSVQSGDAPSPRTQATAAKLLEHWKKDRIKPTHAFQLQSFDPDVLTAANTFTQWLTPCYYLLYFSAASQRLHAVTYLKRVNIHNEHCSIIYDEW